MATRKNTKTVPAADVPGALHGHSEAELKEAVKTNSGIHPVIALEELRRRQVGGLGATLRKQLAQSENADLRASSAALLVAEKGAASRSSLVEALRDKSPFVVRRAAESLGRIGQTDELEALRSVRSRNPIIRRAVDAAKIQLGYALGEKRGLLSAPDPGELLSLGRRESAAFGVTSISLDDTARYDPVLPGFQVAGQACAITCGPWRYLLVFNKKVFTRKGAVLSDQSTVMAALLRSEEATGHFAYYASVLSRPVAGKTLQVSVMRPTGQVLYAGEVDVDTLDFRIRAVKSRHVHPIAFTGSLDIGSPGLVVTRAEVALEKARSQGAPKRPRQIRIRAGR